MKLVAIESFEHNGSRKRGDVFVVADPVGLQLIRAGLCRGAGENPTEAAGEKSSASLVVQALPEQTVTRSKRGGRRKKAGASLQ